MNTNWDTVWIVGASTGIGKELALELTSHAQKVVISARSADKLNNLAEQHDKLVPFSLDVLDTAKIQDTAKKIEQEVGRIDLVIYNAGLWHPIRAKDFDAEKFKASMNVNYIGAIDTIQAVLPDMFARQNGHIALVASVAGYRGLPKGAAYGPTKAALNSLADSLKPDLDNANITMTVINPGFVDTPMTRVNDFSMPFIMSAEKAAGIIVKGLLRKKFEIAFPWQMVTFLKFIRCLPNSLFFWISKNAM